MRVERISPAFRFSRSRYESPLMLTVVAWCSSRSMMVLETAYGPEMARRLYDYNLDEYLRGRGVFTNREACRAPDADSDERTRGDRRIHG